MVWHCVTEDLHEFLSTPWLQVVLVLTSVVCGAIVGAEREKQEKPAGLRTLILVCLGSTAFTMASYAFLVRSILPAQRLACFNPIAELGDERFWVIGVYPQLTGLHLFHVSGGDFPRVSRTVSSFKSTITIFVPAPSSFAGTT